MAESRLSLVRMYELKSLFGFVFSIYLTSSDVDNRSQGTRLLSHVLANLSTHTLLLDEG